MMGMPSPPAEARAVKLAEAKAALDKFEKHFLAGNFVGMGEAQNEITVADIVAATEVTQVEHLIDIGAGR